MARPRKGKLSPEIQDLLDNPVELENPNELDSINLWNEQVRLFSEASPVQAHLMMSKLRGLAGGVFYAGENPKSVPMGDLSFMQRQSCWNEDISSIGQKYRERIKGPLTAIRAYCITRCMNNQTELVRTCNDCTCAFWSFRMGSNPFFGKLPDAEAAVNLEEEPEEDNADS